ncbi:MAG: hypothetical protein JL50_09605 [Peptococcaceae bacterium BICA1-7]|nr:MAG: hypothetical protein JL50_09605 [Peptococcaceae bacterium BICA1-7]HBV95536.1 hypothetical protein [Desulfotomaculum sp.]
MNAKERILAAIEKANGPVCDDCMVKQAELSTRCSLAATASFLKKSSIKSHKTSENWPQQIR